MDAGSTLPFLLTFQMHLTLSNVFVLEQAVGPTDLQHLQTFSTCAIKQ